MDYTVLYPRRENSSQWATICDLMPYGVVYPAASQNKQGNAGTRSVPFSGLSEQFVAGSQLISPHLCNTLCNKWHNTVTVTYLKCIVSHLLYVHTKQGTIKNNKQGHTHKMCLFEYIIYHLHIISYNPWLMN